MTSILVSHLSRRNVMYVRFLGDLYLRAFSAIAMPWVVINLVVGMGKLNRKLTLPFMLKVGVCFFITSMVCTTMLLFYRILFYIYAYIPHTVCQLLEDKLHRCRYWYEVGIYPSKIDTLY